MQKFPWIKLNWETFEEMTLHLAQRQLPQYYFERYLKQGNKQHGIDLNGKSKNIKGDAGTSCTVQCKKYTSLSISDINDIITEFRSGQFSKISERFILSTTADLQKPEIQNHITSLQKDLKDNHNIQFDCWDVSYLESELKNYYALAEYYFGIQTAEDECFIPTQKNEIVYDAVENFIERKIKPQSTNYVSGKLYNYYSENNVSLLSILKEDTLFSKYICLLADAHEGKSTLLRQTAHDIIKNNLHLTPLFIEIKSFNIQPIDQILLAKYKGWRTIPAKELCVIIDGLDEVPTDEFIKAVKSIRQFNLTHASITLIISCRQNFYSHYDLKSELLDFTFYTLLPLSKQDISSFIECKIAKKDAFYEKMYNLNVVHLLNNPFYLIYLTELYTKGKEIPASSIDIVFKFVNDSFLISAQRTLAGGTLLKEKKIRYNIAIRKLALTLQIIGINTVSFDKIQELFSQEDIELFKHSSLLTTQNEQWSFYTTFFQEQLTALALTKLSIEEIMSLISIGDQRKKIKTKWIQTVASLINLLDIDDPISQILIKFIQEDNIEILTKCESSKFTNEFRQHILERILLKCQSLNSGLLLIDAINLSLFSPDNPQTVNILFSFIQGDFVVNTKIIACNVLKNISSVVCQKDSLRKIILDQLNKTDNPYYAGTLIKVLIATKTAEQNDIELLIANPFVEQHTYREAIYELIILLDKVDQYYNFGMAGISALIQHNEKINYSHSEKGLEKFLLATSNCDNLKKLFKRVIQQDWINFYHYKDKGKNSFIELLKDKSVVVFNHSPENRIIIFSIFEVIITLGRKNLYDEFAPLNDFFHLTDTNWLAVQFFFDQNPVEYHWELSLIINEKSFDYLLSGVEDGIINPRMIRGVAHGMHYKGKADLGNKLLELVNAVTGFNEEVERKEWEDRDNQEKLRNENDKKYIVSEGAFKDAIKKYYKLHGKKSIKEDDINFDSEFHTNRVLIDSTFIFHFLTQVMMVNKSSVSLNTCLRAIDNTVFFDTFRMKAILDYPKNLVQSDDQTILKVLKEIYNHYLSKIDTTKPFIEKDDRFHMLTVVYLLREIYIQYRFDTPIETLLEMISWDDAGLRNIKNGLNKDRQISLLIIEDLGEINSDKVRKWILNKLESRVPSSDVQGTLISLCEHLNIHEAKECIGDLINEEIFDEYDLSRIADIYLGMGGKREKLVTVFSYQTLGSVSYFKLATLLIDTIPDILKLSLMKCMQKIDLDIRTRKKAAIYLSHLSIFDGYDFLIELLDKGERLDERYDGSLNIFNVDTKEGLSALEKIGYILLEPVKDEEQLGLSNKETVLNLLYGFASKGEDDLLKVEEFIFRIAEILSDKYPKSREILYHVDRINEKLRDKETRQWNVSSIKKYINKLG